MTKPKLNRRQRYAISVHLAGKRRDRPIAAFLKYWTKETRKSAKEMPHRLYDGHVSPEMIEQIFFSGDHLPSFIRPLNHPAGGRGIPPDASVEPVFSNKAIDDRVDRIDFLQLVKENCIKRALAKKQMRADNEPSIKDSPSQTENPPAS